VSGLSPKTLTRLPRDAAGLRAVQQCAGTVGAAALSPLGAEPGHAAVPADCRMPREAVRHAGL